MGTILSLVGAGFCLSIGFACGKKVTNQLDYAWYLLKEKAAEYKAKHKQHVVPKPE